MRAPLLSMAIASPLLFACGQQGDAGIPPSVTRPGAEAVSDNAAKLKAAAAAEQEAATADCKANIATKTNEYRSLMARKDYWKATGSIRRCSQLLDDPKLRAMVADGEIKAFVTDIGNPKATDAARIRAFELLSRDYPDVAKKHARWHQEFAKDVAQRREEEGFANRFNKSVRPGDTSQQVIANGWGYPSRINRTTTAAGTREQWVYGEDRYLYFTNGVLTAIQERSR